MGCLCVYMHIFSRLSTPFDNSKLPFQVSVDSLFLIVRVNLSGNAIVSSHSVCNQSYNKSEEVV